MSSFQIIKFDDNYIELLKEYPCDNRMQLEKREGELIRQFKNDLVNLSIAGRTNKEYYIDNKDTKSEYIKKYYIDNKDTISEKNKIYQINNKDAIAEQRKQYYIKNKDDILLKAKEQYTCGCGAIIAKRERAIHKKTLKHIAFLQNTVTDDTT